MRVYIRVVVIMMLAVLAGFGTSGVKSAGRICGHFVRIICEKSMVSPSSCPSVCFACINSSPTGRIFVKFDVGNFCENV